MTAAPTQLPHRAVLVLPRVRIQNANAISSPMTWGFPAITAFTGAMTALERRLGADAGMALFGVGVVCHGFEAQVTRGGYTRAFHLTRNPVLQDGSTAGIVEEGRVHLDVTLLFDVWLSDANQGDAARAALAERAGQVLASMRVAGGSVMPALALGLRRPGRPTLDLVADDAQPDVQRQQFRRLARRWMPGFVLVSRDDLLQARLAALRADHPAATVLDAWLDLSRWNTRATALPTADDNDAVPRADWVTDRRSGWIVPIPVGFAALSPLQDPGTVAGARDMCTPFRFVETVWSMGQWISPHRLRSLDEVFWSPDNDHAAASATSTGLYRCVNSYQVTAPAFEPAATADSSTN